MYRFKIYSYETGWYEDFVPNNGQGSMNALAVVRARAPQDADILPDGIV